MKQLVGFKTARADTIAPPPVEVEGVHYVKPDVDLPLSQGEEPATMHDADLAEMKKVK